jgi:hypothetical protein
MSGQVPGHGGPSQPYGFVAFGPMSPPPNAVMASQQQHQHQMAMAAAAATASYGPVFYPQQPQSPPVAPRGQQHLGQQPQMIAFYPGNPMPYVIPQQQLQDQQPQGNIYPTMAFGWPGPSGNGGVMSGYPYPVAMSQAGGSDYGPIMVHNVGSPPLLPNPAVAHPMPLVQTQQPPDLVELMGYRGAAAYPAAVLQPDVIQDSQQEATYINECEQRLQGKEEADLPCYANETVAGEAAQEEQPTYMNDEEIVDAMKAPRDAQRGMSIPPQIECWNEDKKNPKFEVPMRPASVAKSNRPKSTFTMNKSSISSSYQSLNMSGIINLAESVNKKLKEFRETLKDPSTKSEKKNGKKPSDKKEQPKRPPRRKERVNKTNSAAFATLPRNFKSMATDLDIIEEDNVQHGDQVPKVPMPGSVAAVELAKSKSQSDICSPTLMSPNMVLPVVPMPGSALSSSVTLSIPSPMSIPMAGGGTLSYLASPSPTENETELVDPAKVPVVPMPGTEVILRKKKMAEDFKFDLTAAPKVPMPNHPVNRRNSVVGCGDVLQTFPEVSQKYHPELNRRHSMHECGIAVAMTSAGIRIGQQQKSKGDYETVEFGAKPELKITKETAEEEKPNKKKESDYDEVEFKTNDLGDASVKATLNVGRHQRSSSGSSKESDIGRSIAKTSKDIIDGIREMDNSIQNLKIGFVKVYEDVYTRHVYSAPDKNWKKAKSLGKFESSESRDDDDYEDVQIIKKGFLEIVTSPLVAIEDEAPKQEPKLTQVNIEKSTHDEVEQPVEVLTYREQKNQAFREGFFGIQRDDESAQNGESAPEKSPEKSPRKDEKEDTLSDTGTETLDVTIELPETSVADLHGVDEEDDDEKTIPDYDDEDQGNLPEEDYNWSEAVDDSGMPATRLIQEKLK